jgi:hypothetical protein
MTVEQARKEIETFYGKNPPDLHRIRAAYEDLINGRTHSDFLCLCPSCLCHAHKKAGGRFDKEIFFLDWLLLEVQLGRVNQREKIVFEDAFDRGKPVISVDGVDFINFFNARGSVKALSVFLEKYFPEIDHNWSRLNLRLWRFKKSGTLRATEKRIVAEWYKAHPAPNPRKGQSWKALKLAHRIADFIYSRPNKTVTQRELCRRFFQRDTLKDLEAIRPWLKFNYGIDWKVGIKKNRVSYLGTMKKPQGRILRVVISKKTIDGISDLME